MGYKLFEFSCVSCGTVWEDLVERQEKHEDYASPCPECGGSSRPCLSVPKLAMFSLMSKDDQAAHLKKRSADHTQKQIIEKEPEKFGDLGKQRARKGKIQVAGSLPKKGKKSAS
jgi:hypothetical protein